MSNRISGIGALRFHDDFDGIASAALFLTAVESDLPTDSRAVSYSSDRSVWFTRALPAHTAVVDYLHHPDAEYWFDHHSNPFLGPPARLSRFHVWDPTTPSCASLIARHFGLNGRCLELSRWADKIDSARWDSAIETLDWSVPAVRIYNALIGQEFEQFAVHLIGLLRRDSLAEAAQDTIVVARSKAAHSLLQAGMRHLQENARLQDGMAIVECPSVGTPYVVPRYGAYLLYPQADYMLLNQQRGQGWKLTLSRNPWRDPPGPHLGKIAGELGGGGHRDVGAVNVSDHARACEVARMMTERLHRA